MSVADVLVRTLVLVCLAGCGENTAADTGAPSPAEPPPRHGEFFVPECAGTIGDDQDPCYWSYRYNPDLSNATPDKSCSKLVIDFSGGNSHCDEAFLDESAIANDLGIAYADDTSKGECFVAVCASHFVGSEETKRWPYFREAERNSILIGNILASETIRSIWNGAHLFLTGVSHGPQSVLVAAATTDFDDAWHGAADGVTAACFHDFSVSPTAVDQFLFDNLAAPNCELFREELLCDRYIQAPEENATCKQHLAPAPENDAMLTDRIIDHHPMASIAIENFKVIECGSGTPEPCGKIPTAGDALPSEPQQRFCEELNSSPNQRCEWAQQPGQTHLLCHFTPSGIDACLSYFNGLVHGLN